MAQQENRSAFEASLLAELRAAIRTQLEVAYSMALDHPAAFGFAAPSAEQDLCLSSPHLQRAVDQIEILADANGDLAKPDS